MASVAEVQGYADAAIAAMDAGNWELAHTKLLAASAGLQTLPDVESGGSRVTFDREWLDRLIAQVERERSRASTRGGVGVMRVGKIRFGRTSG